MIMHFRIQRWDRYVGIFILLAVVILIASLVFMARGQKWFEKRHRYAAAFAKVQGVKPGTPVTISGMEVGSVHSLRLNPEGKVEIRLDILESYTGFIRTDSEVTIATALLGGKTVEISRGSPDRPPAAERQVLPSQEPRELADLLQEIDLQAPLKKVDEALENLKSLTARLSSPQGELFAILRNVEFISAQLREGRGTAGALLRDPKLYREAGAALELANRSAAGIEEVVARAAEVSRGLPAMAQEVDGRIREIRGILDDIKKATAELSPILENIKRTSADGPAIAADVKEISREVREITGDVRKTTPELPELVRQTQETVEDADQVIAGLRNHWLIRGWVAPTRRDSPIEIGQRQDPYEKKGDAPR
jgi:phospholipid/cholesterol/gamma-HCH transport system substrate-binding protein